MPSSWQPLFTPHHITFGEDSWTVFIQQLLKPPQTPYLAGISSHQHSRSWKSCLHFTVPILNKPKLQNTSSPLCSSPSLWCKTDPGKQRKGELWVRNAKTLNKPAEHRFGSSAEEFCTPWGPALSQEDPCPRSLAQSHPRAVWHTRRKIKPEGLNFKPWELLNSPDISFFPPPHHFSLPPARPPHYCHSASVLATVVFLDLCPFSQLETSSLLYIRVNGKLMQVFAGGGQGRGTEAFCCCQYFFSFTLPATDTSPTY